MPSSVPHEGTQRQDLATTSVTGPSAGPELGSKVALHPSQPFADPIPGIIAAGSLNLISGASGVGKTALVADMCRRWRDGRSICWRPTNVPTKIAVIVGDRKWSDHKQWFEAVGFPDIPHYSFRDDTSFSWDRLHSRTAVTDIFEKAVDGLKLPPGALLIVDPISLFISGNLIDYKAVAIAMGKLDRIITKRKITCLGIMHMAKQKGDHKDRYTRPQDRILGSSALLGFSDTPMYLLGPEDMDDECYGFGWIPHHSPHETFQFVRNEQGLFVPFAAPDQDANMHALLGVITAASEGTKTKEIIDYATGQLAIPTRSVHWYLDKLQAAGKIKRVVRGIWRRQD